jgi:hemerythrin
MSHFKWNADYSVGDDMIDLQHRQLLSILNELVDEIERSDAPAPESARKIFDRLAAYVTEHFDYEERLIAAAGYPEASLAEHRKEHNVLLQKVQDFEHVFDNGAHTALVEMMPFLYGDWLIHHICGTDRDYAPYLATR